MKNAGGVVGAGKGTNLCMSWVFHGLVGGSSKESIKTVNTEVRPLGQRV